MKRKRKRERKRLKKNERRASRASVGFLWHKSRDRKNEDQSSRESNAVVAHRELVIEALVETALDGDASCLDYLDSLDVAVVELRLLRILHDVRNHDAGDHERAF